MESRPDVRYRDRLAEVAKEDIEKVLEKDKDYGASWKKRGGQSAFHVLARKWDRMEHQLFFTLLSPEGRILASPYDIFNHSLNDPRPEPIPHRKNTHLT